MNVPRILGPAHPTRPGCTLVAEDPAPLLTTRRAPRVWEVANLFAYERSRRQLLREGLVDGGMLVAGPIVSGCAQSAVIDAEDPEPGSPGGGNSCDRDTGGSESGGGTPPAPPPPAG